MWRRCTRGAPIPKPESDALLGILCVNDCLCAPSLLLLLPVPPLLLLLLLLLTGRWALLLLYATGGSLVALASLQAHQAVVNCAVKVTTEPLLRRCDQHAYMYANACTQAHAPSHRTVCGDHEPSAPALTAQVRPCTLCVTCNAADRVHMNMMQVLNWHIRSNHHHTRTYLRSICRCHSFVSLMDCCPRLRCCCSCCSDDGNDACAAASNRSIERASLYSLLIAATCTAQVTTRCMH